MRANVGRLFISLSVAFLLPSPVWAQGLTREDLGQLTQAYGYLLGQSSTLDYIVESFPELTNKARLAEMKFNERFPRIASQIDSLLVEQLGVAEASELRVGMSDRAAEILNQAEITSTAASDYIAEVMHRTEGEIPAEILKTFLGVRYYGKPNLEFSDRHYQVFKSAQHRKAKGIDLELKLPQSWQPAEGDRPNIVQKWTARFAPTPLVVALMILEDPDGPIAAEDFTNAVASPEHYTFVPEGAVLLEAGPLTVEGQPGFWLHFVDTRPHMDKVITQEVMSITLLYRGKMIQLMCSAVVADANERSGQQDFSPYKALCNQIGNSIVLRDRYSPSAFPDS